MSNKEKQKKELMNYILNNEIITNFLDNVKIDNNDDFKQHFYLVMLEMFEDQHKFEVLLEMYNSEDHIQLGKFCTGIVHRQRMSRSSYNYKSVKERESTTVFLMPLNSVTMVFEAYEPYEEIDTQKIIKRIIIELNHIKHIDCILFKMYYGLDPITNEVTKPKSYKEIQVAVGIKYHQVRNSIINTKQLLLKKIKL